MSNYSTLSYLTSCLILASVASPSFAAEIKADERIEVQGRKMQQAFPTLAETAAQLKQIAGGTNLIELGKLPARQATLQDALGFEPGIIMQSFFGGNDQPRLNIRGSGVQSNPVNRGVVLLQDGLPLNQADGSFVIGFLDPKSADMIAVYRGANGLRYGATTLGGAVNMISKNGTNSQPSARIEYGNDARIGASVQTGGQGQDWDYFISAGKDSYDGYRHQSESSRSNFNGNFGIDLSAKTTNRTYLSWSDNYFEIPFVVPKAIALNDPKLILGDGNTPLDSMFNIYKRKPFRDSQLKRLANKTRMLQGAALHEFGVFYQQVDDTFTDPLKHAVTDSTDIGLEYSVAIDGDYISRDDHLLLSLSANNSEMSRTFFATNPENGSPLPAFSALDLSAKNLILALQWQAQLTDSLQLVSAVQAVNSDRDIEDANGSSLAQQTSYSSVNPKLGVNYQLSDEIRFFANVSKTMEAPTFWELISVSVSPKNPKMAKVALNDLKQQKSTTLEVGSSGDLENFHWSGALYRSNIDDELISIVSDFAVNGSTSNYHAGTIHQGLELELSGQLTNDMFLSGDNISAKLVYNYSDFYFDGGTYDNKQIAGVPKHLAQLEFQYQTDSGIYIAPSIKWQPSDTPVDHANSQFQDAYHIVSLKFAYQVNDALKVYADMENITDQQYQTSYVIRGYSKATQPTFLPGFGPSYSVGLNYQF